MKLLYQAAKAFNLKIDGEEHLPESITAIEPLEWVEFMNTVPTVEINTEAPADNAEAPEASEETAEEDGSGYEHEENTQDPEPEAAAEESKTPGAAETETPETAELAEEPETAEAAEVPETAAQETPETAEAEAQDSEPEAPETPETDELLGEDDDAHDPFLQQVRELTREFNRVGVTAELYDQARRHVLDTGLVSRKRLRDQFTIGATKASAILKGLELEGLVEKTGANGRRVIPENERKQVLY
jgi:ribosomal protein S25